jgi:uncharacterized protein (TIGR03382 family)
MIPEIVPFTDPRILGRQELAARGISDPPFPIIRHDACDTFCVSMRRLLLLGVLVVACSGSTPTEDVGTAKAAIINGRPSGDDENAAIYIETKGDTPEALLRCSGRIIAPGLVLTARHCLLKRKSANVRCTADGNPGDITDTVDIELEPVERMTVFIGSNRNAFRPVAVRQALAKADITVCRSDIAYLVMAEPGLDTRTPIRRALPAFGETISVTGWGYVDDSQRVTLPDTRSTVETKITDVGPGLIPQGTFAVAGGTLCLGDSGANALIDGAAVGVYTRIDGDPNNCVSELGRNVLSSVMSEPELLAKAFTAIGEEPWFAGEDNPWLAAAGAACTTDDDCRSGVCDASTCRPGCGPTKLACKGGQECAGDGQSCVPSARADAGATPAPPAPAESSCAAAPKRQDDGAAIALVAAAAVAMGRRRRRSPTIRW